MNIILLELVTSNNVEMISKLYSEGENFESCLYNFDTDCLERACIRINAEMECKSLFETFSKDSTSIVSAIENAYDTHMNKDMNKDDTILDTYWQYYVNGSIPYAIYDAVKSREKVVADIKLNDCYTNDDLDCLIKKLYEHLDVTGYRAETEKILTRAENASKEGKIAFMALADIFRSTDVDMQAATIKFFSEPNWETCFYSFDEVCMKNACVNLGLTALCTSEYERIITQIYGEKLTVEDQQGPVSEIEFDGTEALNLIYAIYDRKIKGSENEEVFSSNQTFLKAYNEFNIPFMYQFVVEKFGLSTVEEYSKQIMKENDEASYIRNTFIAAAYFENIFPEESLSTAYKVCRDGEKTLENAKCIEKQGCLLVGQSACDAFDKCQQSYEKSKWTALENYGENNLEEAKKLFLENSEYRKCNFDIDTDCLLKILGDKVSFTPLSGDFCNLKDMVKFNSASSSDNQKDQDQQGSVSQIDMVKVNSTSSPENQSDEDQQGSVSQIDIVKVDSTSSSENQKDNDVNLGQLSKKYIAKAKVSSRVPILWSDELADQTSNIFLESQDTACNVVKKGSDKIKTCFVTKFNKITTSRKRTTEQTLADFELSFETLKSNPKDAITEFSNQFDTKSFANAGGSEMGPMEVIAMELIKNNLDNEIIQDSDPSASGISNEVINTGNFNIETTTKSSSTCLLQSVLILVMTLLFF